MEIIGFLETCITALDGFYYQVKGTTCQDSDVFKPYHEKSLIDFCCQAKSAGPNTNHPMSTAGRLEVISKGPVEKGYKREKDETFG
jgi:hypothetical protein